MHRIVLLMTLFSRAVTPHIHVTVPESATYLGSTVSSTVTMPLTKHRKISARRGKSDSPMLNYIFDSYATSNKHFHDRFKAPSFEGDMSSDAIIDADTGATVLFDCRVSSLRDKTVSLWPQHVMRPEFGGKWGTECFDTCFPMPTLLCAGYSVSWIRVSDDENLELLTVDLETHTADSRYKVDVAGETWKLTLSEAKVQDSGIYCCHVSTHPPMLRRFQLVVHPPEIKMSKEAFLESGETLSLKCAILHLSVKEIIPLLHWYKGNSSVPLDETRGGVLIETDLLTITSHLQVAHLKVEDAGNYTCALEAPISMKSVARVHVLQGSSLAELQSGVKTTTSYMSLLFTSLLFIFSTCNDIR